MYLSTNHAKVLFNYALHIVVICNSNYFENFSTLFVNPLDRVVYDSIMDMGTHISLTTHHIIKIVFA